jgi:hypothetical protein
MKVVTIDSEVYRALVKKIDRIFDYVKRQAEREMAFTPTRRRYGWTTTRPPPCWK